MVLDPPCSVVPVELAQVPVNVWVNPLPKFNVPVLPVNDKLAPLTGPVKVAV